jgi:hypothetical protein
MLTVKQALVIATLNPLPPWKVSVLRSWSSARPFSLKSAIAALESRKVFYCVEVRDAAILSTLQTVATNPALLRKTWKDAQPSRATLVSLSDLFDIVHIAPDWRTVVIAGTIGSLATVPLGRVPSLQGG